MKLLIALSLIACSYAAKLDRTYLPPSSAATAGGSPGALNTPLSGPSGFADQPSGAFGKQSSNFAQQPSGFSGSNGFNKPDTSYGQPLTGGFDSSSYGQSGAGGFNGASNQAQGFGQAQDYQRTQPQRAQAAAEQGAEILRYDNQNDGETFSYNFETSNGIAAEESGVATNGVQAQGAFSYSDDDGQTYRVQYTADENGFQPQGEHLPTPHPIPEEILKSIETNAQAAAAGTQEGAYNPDEDNSDSGFAAQQYNGNAPQQYNGNAASTYNQESTPIGSYNRPQGPSQLYAAPNSGASRPQTGFQPQRPSQQYGASNAGASRPQSTFQPQGPSQQYGAPNGGASRPSNGFGQTKSPAQSYNTDSTAFSSVRPAANKPASIGSGSGARPGQYQAPQPTRPRGFAQSVQAQDESGYQYDRPQPSFGGRQSNQGPSQYRPQVGAQNGAARPSGPQSFSRPSTNYGAPAGPAQGSFGPSSGPSFGVAAGPSAQGPRGPSSFGSFGPSANGRPTGSNGFGRQQGSYQAPAMSGYQYNRPQSGLASQSGSNGQPGFRAPGSATGFAPGSAPGSAPGQSFQGPRQPPSFSEEEGYKY